MKYCDWTLTRTARWIVIFNVHPWLLCFENHNTYKNSPNDCHYWFDRVVKDDVELKASKPIWKWNSYNSWLIMVFIYTWAIILLNIRPYYDFVSPKYFQGDQSLSRNVLTISWAASSLPSTASITCWIGLSYKSIIIS